MEPVPRVSIIYDIFYHHHVFKRNIFRRRVGFIVSMASELVKSLSEFCHFVICCRCNEFAGYERSWFQHWITLAIIIVIITVITIRRLHCNKMVVFLRQAKPNMTKFLLCREFSALDSPAKICTDKKNSLSLSHALSVCLHDNTYPRKKKIFTSP